MKEVRIPFLELGLVAVTRVALGAGLGLLIADFFTSEHRRTIGQTLFAIGVLTTIPLVGDVVWHRTVREPGTRTPWPSAGYDEPSLASFVP